VLSAETGAEIRNWRHTLATRGGTADSVDDGEAEIVEVDFIEVMEVRHVDGPNRKSRVLARRSSITAMMGGLAMRASSSMSLSSPRSPGKDGARGDVDGLEFVLRCSVQREDGEEQWTLLRRFNEFSELRDCLVAKSASAAKIDHHFPSARWHKRVDEVQLQDWKAALE
jgi:hypothetical protein